MFLHLIQSDEKFLPPIQHVFEAAAPGQHCYAMVGRDECADDLRVGSVHRLTQKAAAALLLSRSDWEGVTIHGLPFSVARPLVALLPKHTGVAWYVWGFEAYGFWPSLREGLLMPETRRVVNMIDRAPWKVSLRALVTRTRARSRWVRQLLDRYDYCVTPVQEDFELFVRTGLLKTSEYHWGMVGSLEDFVDISASDVGIGDYIQLGNSADPSNNHIDALHRLADSGFGSRRVVVPLGYGDARYRDEVLKIGDRLLGDRFYPLTGFVPLPEYRRLLSSCKDVVMNHHRQQAWGNILAALWRGARVHMNDTSAYRTLKRLGVSPSLIDWGGGSWVRGMSQPISRTGLALNREILISYVGENSVVRATGELLEKLRSKSGGSPGADSGKSSN